MGGKENFERLLENIRAKGPGATSTYQIPGLVGISEADVHAFVRDILVDLDMHGAEIVVDTKKGLLRVTTDD